MQAYRLIIRRYDRLLGHFETDTPWASEALEEILGRPPSSEGYRIELQASEGERRLLESSPTGIRVLSIKQIYRPTQSIPTRTSESA